MILLQAEMMELKASPKAPATGNVIEAQIEPGTRPTATVIVRMGTLQGGRRHSSAAFLRQDSSALINDNGKPHQGSAAPSTPVKILGFSGLPDAGDEFNVMKTRQGGRSPERTNAEPDSPQEKLATPQRATLENLLPA